MEDGVTHRKVQTQSPEPIDEDEQERIIQQIRGDYESMLKSQDIGFIIF